MQTCVERRRNVKLVVLIDAHQIFHVSVLGQGGSSVVVNARNVVRLLIPVVCSYDDVTVFSRHADL